VIHETGPGKVITRRVPGPTLTKTVKVPVPGPVQYRDIPVTITKIEKVPVQKIVVHDVPVTKIVHEHGKTVVVNHVITRIRTTPAKPRVITHTITKVIYRTKIHIFTAVHVFWGLLLALFAFLIANTLRLLLRRRAGDRD